MNGREDMAPMPTVDPLAVELLSATRMFDRASLAALESLAARSDRRVLRRGEVLVREGDASDRFFIVLSGRFSVYKKELPWPVAEIARGELVGEVGFFAGLPRTATVVACRDSIVLEIGRDEFERAAERLPSLRQAVTTFLARRFALQSSASSHARASDRVRTIAIVAAGGSRIPPRFMQHLQEAFAPLVRARFVLRPEVQTRFARLPVDAQAVLNWLNELEAQNGMVIYVADEDPSEWTRICIRQADVILLIASATSRHRLNPTEELALSVHSPAAVRLVVVHERPAAVVSGTAAWLDERPAVLHHHHVALDDGDGTDRLIRFLCGQARGFVAAGGGARGSAHLGIYKAFLEAGARFDYLGGTSSGAAMMAGFAKGLDGHEIDRGIHNIFIRSRAFRRPTLPRFALLDHKGFDRALQAEYGDVLIEDLWLPFFALSTNLSRHQPYLHRRGKLWHAVRASGSIPGVLPPFFTPQGDMLVDGAIMNNLPLDQMRQLKSGPNVVASLGTDRPQQYQIDYDRIPGASELAVAMLNPFGRNQFRQIPSMLQVIAASMLAHRPQDITVGEFDILVCPEFPRAIGFLDWSRHSELFSHAYDCTRRWLEERLGENDTRLQALLGTGGGSAGEPAPGDANPATAC